MPKKLIIGIIGATALLSGVGDSWAVIVHGPPEGFYTHQMGHVLFFLAMVYIWWVTRQHAGKGWRYIHLSFLLFALWNLDTFLAHWLETLISKEQYVGSTHYWSLHFRATCFHHLVLYAIKLDHLLSVPAAISLYWGLRLLRRKGGSSG